MYKRLKDCKVYLSIMIVYQANSFKDFFYAKNDLNYVLWEEIIIFYPEVEVKDFIWERFLLDKKVIKRWVLIDANLVTFLIMND